MLLLEMLLFVFCCVLGIELCLSGKAPVFSLQTCDGGCRKNEDCPTNAACIPLLGQTCGLCLCTLGFAAEGDSCIYNGPTKSNLSEGGNDIVNKQNPLLVTKAENNHMLTEQQLNASKQDDWDCEQYNCADEFKSSERQCAEKSTTVPCPNLVGGGDCLNGNCTEVDAGKSYCICPYSKSSRTCHVQKMGDCSSTTGITPLESYVGTNKRFVHIRDADYGAVLSRHFAKSLNHCIRLCEWATTSQCRSVNYGPINGQMVCELLTIWASPEGSLFKWLKNQEKWTYVCCFK